MSIPEDDELLAAEYALGTLSRQERTAAAIRRTADVSFDHAVAGWEIRLAPLSESVVDIEPPRTVWAAIMAEIERLGALGNVNAAPTGAVVLQMRRRVAFWRGAAAFSSAIAACLAIWVGLVAAGNQRPSGTALVAVLQASDQAPAFLMRADLRGENVAVRSVAAPAVPGKSYELWMIDSSLAAPQALGLIDAAGSSRPALPRVSADILTRATYAVTVEAAGGSVTGAPTSAPIFFGHLLRTDP